jgi:hypothetical protein
VAELRVEGDGIIAETVRGVRLGALEPKLARRLIKFMQTGNRYQAGVTSCDDSMINLIVRETYQDPRNVGKPSFPQRRKRDVDFRPYAKESLIPRDLDVDSFDEEAEDGEEPAEEAGDLEGLHAVDDDVEVMEDFADEDTSDGDDEEDEE